MMTIGIVPAGITELHTDAVVNAANEGLRQGSGVCGAIFAAAGAAELQAACAAIGHCDTGSAVITPAFRLNAKYIIHAVGPVWQGGKHGEAEKLYGAYRAALRLAAEHGCRSVAFPLISAGIFGYPLQQAWEQALFACRRFYEDFPETEMEILFAVPAEENRRVGQRLLEEK